MFITFEGANGVGKSTQIKKIHKILRNRGLPVVSTREPGGCSVSEKIRKICKKHIPDNEIKYFLNFAARLQHVKTVIRPALDKGMIVLCDRFVDSTIVYQNITRFYEKNLRFMLRMQIVYEIFSIFISEYVDQMAKKYLRKCVNKLASIKFFSDQEDLTYRIIRDHKMFVNLVPDVTVFFRSSSDDPRQIELDRKFSEFYKRESICQKSILGQKRLIIELSKYKNGSDLEKSIYEQTNEILMGLMEAGVDTPW